MTGTSLRRYEPFQELATIRDEMERMFRQMFPRPVEGDGESLLGNWSPHLDVEETAEAFVLHVEVPGVKAEDIELSLDEDVLTIDGERRFYEEKEAKGFRRIERRFGSFHRAIRLPSHVLADKVEAKFADGLLTVTVPKAEEAKPHKIAVKAA